MVSDHRIIMGRLLLKRLTLISRISTSTGTIYNVLVSAVNSTLCPDAPCSEYTIKQKPSEYIYLPQSPNPHVEVPDCKYMFDCQYNVTVETSNLHVRRSIEVTIPRTC